MTLNQRIKPAGMQRVFVSTVRLIEAKFAPPKTFKCKMGTVFWCNLMASSDIVWGSKIAQKCFQARAICFWSPLLRKRSHLLLYPFGCVLINVSSTKFNVFPEIRFISEIGFAELKVHIKVIWQSQLLYRFKIFSIFAQFIRFFIHYETPSHSFDIGMSAGLYGHGSSSQRHYQSHDL